MSDREKAIQELEEFLEKGTVKDKKTGVSAWWDDVVWEINYQLREWFYYPYRRVTVGFENLIKYRSLIWNDRWYDHSFLMELMLFKLKDMEKRWGKDTHYIGDLDEKDTLKKLIVDLEWMLEADEFDKNYAEEYKKKSRSFFGRMDRNHRKFWD